MTDRELMQQAYAVPLHEQLASVPESARLVIDDPDGMGTRFIPVGRLCHEAAAALRERLAQPEQEPVAWISEGGDVSRSKRYMDEMGFECNPLYAAPQRRDLVGLTDDEIALICGECAASAHRTDDISYARAIEAKLREKNT